MSALVHLEVTNPQGVAQGTVAARHIAQFGSAAELARTTLAQGRDLPAGFESFTCVQMNEFYLSHGVEMALDYAAALQREAGLIKRENAMVRPGANADHEGASTAVDTDNGAGKHELSLASTATRPPVGRTHPAHYQAHGRLYRAIVSLPESMCARDRPLQERWVFFDCPTTQQPSARLETLLSLAWNIDTAGWADSGYIYSVIAAPDLIAQNDADDDTALFECEWGGSEGTKHVPLHDVDFFCTPRVRARLELALLQAHVGKVLEGGAA